MKTEATAAIAQRIDEAAAVFINLGATHVDIHLPGFSDISASSMVCLQVDAASIHGERLKENPGLFGADVAERLRLGASKSGVEYAIAHHAILKRRGRVSRLFEDVDVVIMPTVRVTAPSRDDSPDMVSATHRLTRLTAAWSAAGVPALSVPCGFVDDMPVGMQLVAPAWSEAQLLACGISYQAVTSHHTQRPPLQ
jgi:aspartyl-tRNA(Asn)/glutamyl-tRNA(Gln) amidotransferase subunit A